LLIWQATRPQIIIARVANGLATVAFLARAETGKLVPTSISFGGAAGSWRVAYFALLNLAIQRAEQLRVQAQLEPLATNPNPKAVRQGIYAASLQGIYLERKFGVEAAPAKP